MAAWLDSTTTAKADTAIIDNWSHVTGKGDTLQLHNVLARFNPSARERILYVTHWDTRPRADAAGSDDPTAPVLGANDGASGVALLLGVADALRTRPPSIGVDLLFVDGEDYGSFSDTTETLLGARRFANNLRPNDRPTFAVVWDLVGDRDLRFPKDGYSVIAAPDVVERVWELGQDLGYAAEFTEDIGMPIIDDHLPLQLAGIKAIAVIDLDYGPQNSWHHTTEDTRDKISSKSLAISTHVATALIRIGAP